MSTQTKSRLNTGDHRKLGDDGEAASDSAASLDGSSVSPAVGVGAGVGVGVGPTTETIVFPGSGMVFNNTYGSGVSAAFRSAILTAENALQSQFTNSVTLDVSFDLAALGSQFSAQNYFMPLQHVAYATLVSALAGHATTPDDLAAVAALPPADPTFGAGFAIPLGMARNLGLAGGATGIDDTIVLNNTLPWTFGADAAGVLEHEISEGALGRIGGLGIENGWWGPMDLFRYSAVNQRDYAGGLDGLPSFFSVDGTSLLLPLHNSLNPSGVYDGQDFADWAASLSGDAFGASGPGAPGAISATDLRVMDILGWTPTTATTVQAANFAVTDTTTNSTATAAGDAYNGPVPGLEHQYINLTPDSLNITASAPNSFIHSGSGMDGINVSMANGNNILDGSTGSNFLVGGTGNDTFYLDDRAPASPIFSTIVNFHSGDNATVWGVDAADFKLTTLDNQGAAGALGLDLIFTAPGHIDTSFVLAGYTSADLLNGRLTTSYGTTASLPGVPGSQYLTVHAA